MLKVLAKVFTPLGIFFYFVILKLQKKQYTLLVFDTWFTITYKDNVMFGVCMYLAPFTLMSKNKIQCNRFQGQPVHKSSPLVPV